MLLVMVALVLFYVITQPTVAVDAVTTVLGSLKDGAATVIGFLRNLFG